MKIRHIAALTIAGFALVFGSVAHAQGGIGGGKGDGAGGTWNGPGDTVPPGGAGGAVGPPPGQTPPPPGGLGGNPGSLPGRALPPWGDGPPPPGTPGAPTTDSEPEEPGSRPRVDDPASWQLWWHYNRWEFLQVDFEDLEAKSGAGGFYLGRGEKSQPTNRLRATRSQIHDEVIPALAEALRTSQGNEFRIHGLQAMAKLRGVAAANPDDEFELLAARFITSNAAAVSEKAILSLGVRGDASAFLRLHAVLHNETEGRAWLGRSNIGVRLRCFAGYALGLLGERHEDPGLRNQITTSLLRALEDERPEVRAAAVTSIGLVPLPLERDEAGAGNVAYYESGWIRVEQVLALLELLDDPEQAVAVQAQVPKAVASLLEEAPEALRARVARRLLDAVAARSEAPRELAAAAVIGLGRIGNSGEQDEDVEIRRELERIAFRSHDARLTRYRAILSLARVASRAGAGEEPLVGLEPTRRLFRRNLSRHRGDSLCWTALGLGLLEEKAGERDEVPDASSAEDLRALVERARSAEVVGAAAIALGLLRDQEAEVILTRRIESSGNSEERAYCALALGMIGARQAIPALRAQLEASLHQPFPLEQMAIALSLLGDQATGTRLQELQTEISDPAAQASIASALGWIKDPRPLDEMAARLADESISDALRAWTAVGIGRICDEDPVPWVGRLSIDAPYEVVLPTLIESEFGTGLLDLH